MGNEINYIVHQCTKEHWQCTKEHWQCTKEHWQCTKEHWQCTKVHCKKNNLQQNNTYKIRVKEPCHKNWQGMIDTAVGKYCNSCAKEVIDFTSFTDNQIIDYLKQNGLSGGCGRFLNTQLEQIKIVIDEEIVVYKLAYWKKFIIALLICFGGKCLNADISLGQIVKQDSSIIKNDCDSFNTGETYEKAVENLNKEIKDSAVLDSSLVADTTIKKADTIKIILKDLKIDSNYLIQDFDVKRINITTTLGFFVPYLEKKSFVWIDSPVNEGKLLEGILPSQKIEKEKTEKANLTPAKIDKQNEPVKRKKQTDKIPTEAVLPTNRKKRKKNK